MPEELMDSSTMNQPIPVSQTMHQHLGDVAYQEFPNPTYDKVNDLSKTRRSYPAESDILPTVIGSDEYRTAVGSDEYPTPISSPVPTSRTPGLQSSMEQEGYYAPDQKSVGGFAPAWRDPGVAFYQQAGTLGAMVHTHDPENPAVGHAGVISIVQKPPRRMVNCCGKQFTQKSVIILSSVAALLIIVVIGVGAGLGARAVNNKCRVTYYNYKYC
ncbi:hypothetical protein EV426DRAFT_76083 [Tirmania nivea]|nr:hypothetical protein EV426DRAFT_76083 [Tirmania nivea]